MTTTYTSDTYIQAEFKSLDLSTSTTVNSTTAGYFRDEFYALINAKISRKYVTPLTGSVGLLVARQIETLLCSHRIRKILAVSGQNPGKNQSGVEDEEKTALSMIDDIIKGIIPLAGETLSVSGDGVRSYTYENDVSTEFDVESDTW